MGPILPTIYEVIIQILYIYICCCRMENSDTIWSQIWSRIHCRGLRNTVTLMVHKAQIYNYKIVLN